MSLINDSLKNITLKELCIVIISLYIIYSLLNTFDILSFSSTWIYLFVIFYFAFKLKDSFSDFKKDFLAIFSSEIFGYLIVVVILNIFFSYGMLYLSDFILKQFSGLDFLINFHLSSIHINNSLIFMGSFIATVLISPISEELIFRGVVLNRLRIFLPTVIAIAVTSLAFASLHSYGSIISAFIFAFCMAILYLKTDNILVPIFAHFLNNFLAESIRLVDAQNMLFNDNLVMGIMSILAIISMFLIISLIIKEVNNIK